MNPKLKKAIKFTALSLAGAFLLFFVLHLCFPLKIKKDYSQVVMASDGTVLHAFLSSDQKWRMYTELNEITPVLKKAILNKEDKYFYYHYGINPLAIVRATFNNVVKARKTSGASTITMQVARMLEPKRRSYFNKIIEVFRAVQLEWVMTKEEILQLYLNLVPYGGNIEGVKAASLLHFGVLPKNLNLAQATVIAIVPNRPNSLQIGKNNERLIKERNRWLNTFKSAEVFPAKDIEDALLEPLTEKRHDAPKRAPHLSLYLKNLYPDSAIIRSTIRRNIQDKIENLTFNYMQRLSYKNIHNAAVIVVNNSTHRVEAYLGSPDFKDHINGGQVDGTRALRSPGSTLKPLIYGLAMDKGLITPKSVIPDVPCNFLGYSPENFDMKYNGLVTVEKSLAFSLNVPAVRVLDQLGTPTLLDKLCLSGFSSIQKSRKKLGLSVALGGCGVTLTEMAGLYSSFPNKGVYSPLKFITTDTTSDKTRILTEASSFMVSSILTQLIRPDYPNNYQSSYHIPKIAWKTGTSYGRKDAWSIGYNKKYTIAVWVGNFDGTGVPELSGADIATPLLFQVFNLVDYNSANEWFVAPREVSFRLVCQETGDVPSEDCSNTVIDYFIPSVSSGKKCEHQKMVCISADEQFSYCTSCLPEAGYKKKTYPNLPAEVVSFYDAFNIIYTRIPGHNPSCERVFKENPPKILNPVDTKEYLMEKSDKQELMLCCQADNEVKNVYWYINDRFYKSAPAKDKVFFVPDEGSNKISCTDDKGRNTNCWVTVKYY